MKKIIRLTESDLTRIVKRVIKEEENLNNTQPSTGLSLEKMIKLLEEKGFYLDTKPGYSYFLHKSATGRWGPSEGAWNYEVEVPANKSELRLIKKLQDSTGKRKENETIIITLQGPPHKVVTQKNGRTINLTNKMSATDIMNMLKNYKTPQY